MQFPFTRQIKLRNSSSRSDEWQEKTKKDKHVATGIYFIAT